MHRCPNLFARFLRVPVLSFAKRLFFLSDDWRTDVAGADALGLPDGRFLFGANTLVQLVQGPSGLTGSENRACQKSLANLRSSCIIHALVELHFFGRNYSSAPSTLPVVGGDHVE